MEGGLNKQIKKKTQENHFGLSVFFEGPIQSCLTGFFQVESHTNNKLLTLTEAGSLGDV